MDLIKEFIKRQDSNKIKVGIVGDIILDEYHQVIVERISPEFPIEILKSQSDAPYKICFGGASNVANLASAFNVGCTLFGYADEKSTSVLSSAKFKSQTIKVNSIPRKKRFYSNGFPLVRWDVEETIQNNTTDNDLLNLIQNYIKIEKPDIIILSDYGKGVFSSPYLAQNIISLCNDLNILTLVDPKADPMYMWRGCTVFKVNQKEFDYFCKKQDTYPEELINILGCKYLIVTNAEHDIDLYDSQHNKKQISYKHGKAKSVVGAGDCMASILGIAYAHKFNIEECITIAGLGSSVYVEKEWNEPITPFDLLNFVDPIASKLVTAEWLSTQNLNLILANGVFDLIGTHHLDLLKFAKSKNDKLVVAVNSDESVKVLKGESRPILPLAERMQILASLEFVDFVVSFNEETPYETIRKIQPDMLIKGSDYENKNIAGREFVKEVILFPFQEGKSTTNIIEKIKCLKS